MRRAGLRGAALQGWSFDRRAAPLLLPDDPALKEALLRCLDGWSLQPVRSRPDEALAIAREASCGRWKITSRYSDRPTGALPLASAVCALIADLSLARLESGEDLLGLHAAAVALGGQAFVLTGPARAGKTSFATRLAAEPGAEFICDDVLAITPDDQAMSFGIAPRLRLPLPPDPTLRRLLGGGAVLQDDRYAYVRLPSAQPCGAKSPIAAILSFERRGDHPPSLRALPPEAALPLLLRQTLTRFETASQALDRLTALTMRLPRARLICSDPDEGIALLRAWQAQGLPQDLPEALLPLSPQAAAPDLPRPASGQIFARNPAVRLRASGQMVWLWQEEDGFLWELNPMAHALWQMLEMPGSVDDLAEVMAELFPDTAPARIREDLGRCLAQFHQEGLVVVR
ncbi:PqqD family peptide modification chaperone [Falsigemmobacter intermedius]|uniref:PqqD family peptide modification chaperone n=1 Tax=Falsigemmobacter intermedius TaxID=1553448 RepID=A0A444MBA6_9RHOB|nr:PqqD family peptide modification chaperone [Falsigemmobacter intermedius]RWY41010.1 PqqD family peptide modification chaperone [Falsigemmobacter intermedius]